MCWSAEVSLHTFIFGVISAIIVYSLNVVSVYTIFIFLLFTSIQLLEYFAWTYIDNKKINEILSYIGAFLIIIQMIMVNYLLPNKKESRILLIAYSIFLILFILIELKNIKFKMTKGENGHLVWHWMDIPLPWAIIGVITFYLIPIYLSKSYIGVCFTGIIFFTSLYYYFKAKTWGTMWCYFSNIAWIFFIIKSIIIKLNIYI